MRVNRLEIHLVGNAFRGLDGGNVRIHQHTLDTLFAQGFQGLRARVVKLASLSDFQRARTEYEHLLKIHCVHFVFLGFYVIVYVVWSAFDAKEADAVVAPLAAQ